MLSRYEDPREACTCMHRYTVGSTKMYCVIFLELSSLCNGALSLLLYVIR